MRMLRQQEQNRKSKNGREPSVLADLSFSMLSHEVLSWAFVGGVVVPHPHPTRRIFALSVSTGV